IPLNATIATLTFTNAKGQLIKTIAIRNRGGGLLTFNTSMLAPGTYNFTLHVDGKTVETKRMVVVQQK
ncbi:MAG TPA: hypothetical protein VM187_04505, partial [Niastella sp.]|nr:hypothetical protein [Niastella sp.]